MNKKELHFFIYMIIHDWHSEWSKLHKYAFNNEIIDYLRNRLANDAVEWRSIYYNKNRTLTPSKFRNKRLIESDITFRKFKFGFKPQPCEICGEERIRHIAHIIPRSEGGPDDDWNLIFLCANHHYLFDNNKLSKEEWDKIDWSNKGTEAQHYIDSVKLFQLNVSWNSLK